MLNTYSGLSLMPFDQSSRYTFTFSPLATAMFTSFSTSSMCSSGVFFNCPRQCFSLPLQSRLMTFPPASRTHSADSPLSTKPSTSTFSICPFFPAQSQMRLSVSNSPDDTRADVTSTRGIWSSSTSSLNILSFSLLVKLTPEVCSPSRRVVSIISMRGYLIDCKFIG